MRIVVAMSGGVDSSVAAALLARQGHDVIGLSMQLYDQREGQPRFGTCCTIDDLHDARRVAAHIGIPHYIVNFERQFSETVISNFVEEYAAGRTPIPCVHCNGDLKFATLVARAEGLGADFVATGHYARVERDGATGRYLLKRGVDAAKDQSYFLFTLDQAQLAHAMFPVGTLDKAAVRRHARELGLQVAEKHESQEICFVPDGDHAAFLERQGAAAAAGAIRDIDGRVIGRHDGVHRFTVGQRKGLGLSSPIPLYVVGIDAVANTVTVGPRAALEQSELTASGVNWIAGVAPAPGARLTARIRHRHREAPATMTGIEGDTVHVRFDEPQSAVAPGQAAVFYDGDVVLGGGWIAKEI
ncbi:MAG: tRNA 2-thiouridine(34) synthase MnmA [Acidobacteria bacterium RIFCSPLOWO2_02_FULL_67_36]|nr:MAG: tRNA 2-thiouridine(34) synthase MnmA [Acidobacteria bacterium RIFCSPLOWO2_02_FULL_67_36]OFW25063.1 MAG: tRNA 2-thiouridine(34) synthase MnmA [Acidobacteria bacterium RIFCSPLOWO2_12_FULL_66_21]